MAARKVASEGKKPEKLMHRAIMLELKATDKDEKGRIQRNDRLVARALVRKAKEGDIPAIREVNDRSDGKIINMASYEDGGLRLEDLIHMSYQAGKQSRVEKRPEPKLLPVVDIKADKVE